MARVTVHDYEAGLLYTNGKLQGVLSAGTYSVWRPFGRREIVVVDKRARALAITGQDVITKDKVNVRITLAVQYRVAEPVKAISEVQSFTDRLYQDLQLPLRRRISELEIDTLLETTDQVDGGLLAEVAAPAATYGIELIRAGIKDVILPGELRSIFQRVVEAKKTAQAALVAAREEAATLRTRNNTLALLKENPALLELLRLDAVREVAKTGHHTLVFGAMPHDGTERR